MIRRRAGVRIGTTGALLAQILEFYPKKSEIYITSGTDGDHGDVSHHYGLSYQGSPTAALDIGAGGITAAGSRRMRDLAKWLYDHFAAATVELIHTTPFSTDNGFYVKNRKKYPGGGPYAGATARAHRDHVHFATSKVLAEQILAGLRGAASVPRPRGVPARTIPTAQRTRLALPYLQAASFGGVRSKTQLLVIHSTDNARASAEDEAQYMRRRTDQVSCHVVVDANSAVQTVPLDRIAFCAFPTANSRSIHLELCGVANALAPAVVTRGAKVAAVICERWEIPIVNLHSADLLRGERGICGHDEVTAAWHTGIDQGASHTDPGSMFPWDSFIAQVQREFNRLYAMRTGIHIVRRGDTLTAISRRYDTTIARIRAMNPHITNPDLIRVGDKIKVD